MLMAALVCGFSLCVISCSDDDDNSGKSEEQKEQEAHQKASKFWDVVGQLVSDDVTEDYATKTFEPTYGNADPNDPQTRIVFTNDLKTAAKRFADLVGTTKVDENTQTYTYRDDEVGELIYTKGDGTTAWATVDVNIKQLPHLSRIIYRKAGEGENGSFNGKAYYRFGDVISHSFYIDYNSKDYYDTRGLVTQYWICVRPAFGPEGKEDSHWVCVNTVTEKNCKYYHASNGNDYWLPTNLKTNKEQMQNFAELLYAICNPKQWYQNADYYHTDGRLWGYDGVPIFHDFTKKNLSLHNEFFWQNVQNAWKNNKIADKALNLENFDQLSRSVNTNGVRLLYNGYSWWFTTSWYCQLWEAIYTNGNTNEEKNMHQAKYVDDLERNMKDNSFNCRSMGKDTENYAWYFADPNKPIHWTILHATGKELASAFGKKYDVKTAIPDYNEVYRYYAAYKDEAGKKDPKGGDGPEITEKVYEASDPNQGPDPNPQVVTSPEGTSITNVIEGDLGRLVCTAGHIHSKNAMSDCTAKRVAMIAYVGYEEDEFDHGIAIALEDLNYCYWKDALMKVTNWSMYNGVAASGSIWRLPTRTEWCYMLKGIYTSSDEFVATDFNNLYKASGGSAITDTYWTSSQDGFDYNIFVDLTDLPNVKFKSDGDVTSGKKDDKDERSLCNVRPVLAF